jgi:Flp pilus assembly protein TadD
VGAVLAVITLLAYLPAVRAAFIWNDADYVTSPALRSLHGLWRIWFEVGATEQYYPLLHSAFWVQHQLWGDAPAGYHLVNILLHAASACLFAAVLRRLAVPGAWLAAFIFALHPVCVESVAWVSEQKNTWSLAFYLSAALAYLRYDDRRHWRAYAAATFLFVLGLLSKSVTATLPPTLLVVFWWRRGRIDWRRDVVPLLPWFVLGAAMGLFSAWVERRFIGAEGAEFALSLVQRCLLAGRIVWFYLAKLFWPADLIFIYPRWEIDVGDAAQWIFPIAALGLAGMLWTIRHRTRAPLAAALLFIGNLFPVLGFFNVYGFIFSFVADHWQYLPSLAIVALAAAGFTLALARTPSWLQGTIPLVLIASLGILTWRQSRMYRDMETFYRTTIAQNPSCWMARNNLGSLLREAGRTDEAFAQFTETLRLKPDSPKAHNNLGNIWLGRKNPAAALPHFEQAARLAPTVAEYHNNLATALRDTGRLDGAIRHHVESLRLDASYHGTHNNYGVTLRAAGRAAEAIAQFEEAVRLEPTSAPAHLNLALSFSLLGRDAEAAAHYREARRLNPALPDLPGMRP